MKMPLILLDGHDAMLFASSDALARYVESPDIATYRAFDAEGRRLNLRATTSSTEELSSFRLLRIERVHVEASDELDSAELQRSLAAYCEKVLGCSTMSNDLPAMLVELEKRIGIES